MADKRSYLSWIFLGIVILALTALSLYPLFKTDIQANSSRNKKVSKSIEKALEKEAPKLFPEGDYKVNFKFTDNGYWFTSYLVSDSDLITLAKRESIKKLYLRTCEVTDKGYKVLQQEPLEDLVLFRPQISKRELYAISSLNGLKALTIRNQKLLDDKMIQYLVGPIGLKSLGLKDTKVGDKAMAHITRTFPNLEALNLRACKNVTEAGLNKIVNLKSLYSLILNNVKVTEAGLREIAKIKSLRDLDLVDSSIDDKKLKALTNTGLKRLNISENAITPKAFESLARMKQLKNLKMMVCPNITEDSLARFKKSHPDITIRWSREVTPKKDEIPDEDL